MMKTERSPHDEALLKLVRVHLKDTQRRLGEIRRKVEEVQRLVEEGPPSMRRPGPR